MRESEWALAIKVELLRNPLWDFLKIPSLSRSSTIVSISFARFLSAFRNDKRCGATICKFIVVGGKFVSAFAIKLLF